MAVLEFHERLFKVSSGVTKKVDSTINERAQKLLKSLVEIYIREGQPVGSSTLVKSSNLDLSPATVRNVISDLERMGLVSSPHTSSGRVPTAKGYRLFVDRLLTVKPLDGEEVRTLQAQINSKESTHSVLESATKALSAITQLAGVVTIPRNTRNQIRQIEFIPLSERRILAILVYDEHNVENRIIHTDNQFTQAELLRIANFLNAEFLGHDVQTIRHRLLESMSVARESMDRMMLSAISMANQVFQQDSKNPDFIMAGEFNLMAYTEMADIAKLRQLFETFSEKQTILNLLDQSLRAPGLQIYIGKEAGYDALQDCSVITASYSDENEVIGSLAVIGPTRMAYDRIIPIVDVTANMLGSIMKQHN